MSFAAVGLGSLFRPVILNDCDLLEGMGGFEGTAAFCALEAVYTPGLATAN